MKKLLNYIPVLGVAMAFAACESDLDGATYNSETAQPAVLNELATTNYVLESRNSENVAFTLEWTKPDLGYPAIVTTTIDLDLAGENFGGARQLASVTTATSQEVTVGSLNSAIINLLHDYGIEEDFSARDFEIRLSSSISQAEEPLHSNVLMLNITPYSMDIQYPEIYIIGDYNGWSQDESQQSLFSFSEDGVNFEGIIDFNEKAANGFKLKGAIDNWDNGNWGTDSNAEAPDAEAASIQLINDGGSGDIKCYSHRFYHFSFNNSTLVLNMNRSFDALYLVGSAEGLTWDTSKPENQFNFDPETQRFYKDFTFTSDSPADGSGGIKFLTDTGTWLGIPGDAEEGTLGDGNNIQFKAGSYRIYVNMNNSNKMTYELNAEDYQGE